MHAHSALDAFPLSLIDPGPVPAAYAEPVERLLESFQPDSVAFLLRAQERVQPDWLTAERILKHLGHVLMEPAQPRVWPLVEGVWAIAIRVEGSAESPANALRMHTLRHALTERLEADWRTEAADDHVAAGPLRLVTEDTPEMEANEPVFHLTPIAAMTCTDEIQDNIAELNALLEIIVNKQLRTQFQPIVNLRDGRVFGYEALIRGPKGAPLQRSGALFRAADKASLISWLDIACQEECFARAAQQGIKHALFINMDAEGLAFLDLHERSLALRAREYGLTPANIVIEITERQTVRDFPRLVSYIARLREEGFKIAIDDAGAGYNSLHAISEMRPEFVKIGRSLIRNIDVNGERRALLAALVQYARHIGTSVLAEGSETRMELSTLIGLGIPYGQGYLMGKPTDNFRGVPRETREFIQQRAQQRVQVSAGRTVPIGGLAQRGMAFSPDTLLSEAARCFAKDLSLTSVVIVEDGHARGLVMRHQLESVLDMAKAAHVQDLLPAETLSQWMRTNILFADEEASVGEIARQATTRADISLESDIVIVRNGHHYVGILPMRTLMEAALQENRRQEGGRR